MQHWSQKGCHCIQNTKLNHFAELMTFSLFLVPLQSSVSSVKITCKMLGPPALDKQLNRQRSLQHMTVKLNSTVAAWMKFPSESWEQIKMASGNSYTCPAYICNTWLQINFISQTQLSANVSGGLNLRRQARMTSSSGNQHSHTPTPLLEWEL